MATEFQELRLSATLTDNVSAQLERIKKGLQDIGSGSGVGLQHLKRQTAEVTAQFRELARGLTGAKGAAEGIVLAAGAAGVAVTALGAVVAREFQSLQAYANEMQRWGQLAKQTGISAADLRAMSEALERSGETAGQAATNLAGLAHAMADIGRANSELRQTLLRGLQGDNRAAMEALLGDLGRVANNPEEFANRVSQALDDVYSNILAKTGSSTRAAEVRKNLAQVFGVSADFRGQFAEMSQAQRKMMDERVAAAREFGEVTTSIGQSWSHINEAIHSAIMPAAITVLRPLATVFESIAGDIERIGEALKNPP